MSYAEQPSSLQSTASLFKDYQLPKKKRATERGELLSYFHEHARGKEGAFKISYIAYKLSHLSVQDLYYMKSICESESKRGTPWNKVFWGLLKVPVDK